MKFGRRARWLGAGVVLVGLSTAATAAGVSAWIGLARMRGAVFAALAEVDAAGRVRNALVANLIDASRSFNCPDRAGVERLEQALERADQASLAAPEWSDRADLGRAHASMNETLNAFWAGIGRTEWTGAALVRQDFESRLAASSVRFSGGLMRLEAIARDYREASGRFPGSWVGALTGDVPVARLAGAAPSRVPSRKQSPPS